MKDEDWNEVWKRFYKPFRAGTHLVVKPTWEAYTPQPGDLIMEIDPGMAFGSGILAIGAALLGSQDVLAVDIDPTAVKVAKENIAQNHLENRIRATVGNLL